MNFHHLMFFLHELGVIVWMGGMAFIYLCLYPATLRMAPALRLTLWAAVLTRFFRLAWAAVVLILLSGIAVFYYRGYASAPMAWHAMSMTGTIMMIVYVLQWSGPWRRLRAAVLREDWASAAIQLNAVLRWIGFNLGLGMVTIALATLGLAM